MTLADAVARIADLERENERLQRTLKDEGIQLSDAHDRVIELEREVADYDASFALYDTAQRALNTAYAAAHPAEAAIAMHDAGKVSRWAAERLAELEQSAGATE